MKGHYTTSTKKEFDSSKSFIIKYHHSTCKKNYKQRGTQAKGAYCKNSLGKH